MKKLFILFFVLTILCGCTNTNITETKENPSDKEVSSEMVAATFEPTEEDPETYLVYRTESGTKYHRDGCIHLKSRYELTLEEAEIRGLTPCAVCQP